MVRSVMAVLALTIFPSLATGQQPAQEASRDGVAIGDEYVTFFGDGSTEEIMGRLRVVLTEEETSSAEIVTVMGPVFQVGTPVLLDRKMR